MVTLLSPHILIEPSGLTTGTIGAGHSENFTVFMTPAVGIDLALIYFRCKDALKN